MRSNAREGPDPDPSGGLESFLGSADRRYFGRGYRRTIHEIPTVEFVSDRSLRALAAVTYAPDWSMRSGQVPVPHLSSIDAVVLSASMGQVYLEALGLTPGQVSRAWVDHFSVRTGREPVEDLQNVPATAELVAMKPISSLLRTTDLRVRLGNFVGRISLIHELPARRRAFSERIVRSSMPEIYAHLYRETNHRVSQIQIATDRKTLRCITSLDIASAGANGLSGDYWPMPALIDCIVLGGQMAEVLIFANGIDRENSTGVWLRRISMKAPCPTAHVLRGPSFARLDGMEQFRRDGWRISTFEATVEVCQVHIKGSLAVAEPA